MAHDEFTTMLHNLNPRAFKIVCERFNAWVHCENEQIDLGACDRARISNDGRVRIVDHIMTYDGDLAGFVTLIARDAT